MVAITRNTAVTRRRVMILFSFVIHTGLAPQMRQRIVADR